MITGVKLITELTGGGEGKGTFKRRGIIGKEKLEKSRWTKAFKALRSPERGKRPRCPFIQGKLLLLRKHRKGE